MFTRKTASPFWCKGAPKEMLPQSQFLRGVMYRYPAIPEQCNMAHNELDTSSSCRSIYDQFMTTSSNVDECPCNLIAACPPPNRSCTSLCALCEEAASGLEAPDPTRCVFSCHSSQTVIFTPAECEKTLEMEQDRGIHVGGGSSKRFVNSLSLTSCSAYQTVKNECCKQKERKFSVVATAADQEQPFCTSSQIDCRHDHGVHQYLPGDCNPPDLRKRQSETFTSAPTHHNTAQLALAPDYVTLTNDDDVTTAAANGPIKSRHSSSTHYRGSSHSLVQPSSTQNASNRMHQSFHSQSDLTFHCQQTPEHSRHNRSSSRSNRSMQRSNQNIHAGVLTAAETTLNESGSNATAGNFGVNDTVLGQSPRHVAQNGSGVNIRLGLTSKQALERLFHEVNNELQLFSQQNGFNRSFKSFWTSLPYHYHHKLSTLRLHELMLIVLAAVSLLLCYFLEPSLGGTLIIEAVGIITLLFLSSVISWWDLKLQKNDMFTRAQNILDQIQETLLFMQQQSSSASTLPAASSQPLNSLMACQNVWPESLYPSLHAPVSPSVTLQWTHRDQTLVNLPVNLLVRGDVVEVRPGHTVHVKVKQLQMNKSDPMGLLLNPGQTYNPLEGQAEDPCPSARLHSPMDRLACVVQETPFITQLRKCLKSGREKPKSCWENKRFAICVDLIEKKILPVAVLTGLFINGVRYIATASINSVGHQIEMYLLLQVYILIPLVPLLFPVLWLIWTALTTASLFAHCQQQSPVVGKVKQGKWSHFKLAWKHFISIISGMSPSLSRTANLLHGLGSTTIFSVVDKRGVLSWPNPKVERVFFIRPVVQPEETISRSGSISGRHHDQDQVSDDGSVNAVYVPEIMDMSCDQDENFFVHFDDERWQQHLPSLKPLGLNILLNTCNESVEDSYTKFADHLLCVSSLENHSIAVVNRRCACELSEAIGFAKNATESYEVKNYIQSFRESQPFDPSDTFKVRRIKAILRKKTPFPFLCSVVVHDTSTGLQQLFTQGTADMLCDVCPDFWDGRGIHPLSPELRKKIHDFYTRSSLSAYCTAFAYRPVFSDFSKVLDNFYLELPGGKNASAETDNIHSTDYVSDAKGLAKAQSGQIFLGMVVMQYKAMPDVIDLIEDFDSRCIRFVHFSHENELRSRIFAEKLGLETGWNCHVSLFASSAEPQSSEHSSKAASLTTLRSFAQNVIQANEKLKNLQSQTNLNLDTSANVATENNNVSSTMVTGNNISYSNSANVQGANTQEYLSSSHNLSSSHRGCGGAEDSASTSSPLTNQHSELVAANHRLSNMTTAVSTLDRHHPSMMTGAPENASSTIDMRSLPHKQLSRYQTFSNHQDTTIPRYPNHASMEQHNGGLRSHSNQESRMSNIETHYNQSCKDCSRLKQSSAAVAAANSTLDNHPTGAAAGVVAVVGSGPGVVADTADSIRRLGDQHLKTAHPLPPAPATQNQQHYCNHTSSATAPHLSNSNSFSLKRRNHNSDNPSNQQSTPTRNIHTPQNQNCQSPLRHQTSSSPDRIPSHRAAFQPSNKKTHLGCYDHQTNNQGDVPIQQQQSRCHSCGDHRGGGGATPTRKTSSSQQRVGNNVVENNPHQHNHHHHHMWYPDTPTHVAGDSITSGICSMSSDEGVVSLRNSSNTGAQASVVPFSSQHPTAAAAVSSSCNSAFSNHSGNKGSPAHVTTANDCHQSQYQPFHSLSKYVEVGVQTPNSGMDDDSSSHKGGFNSKDDSEDVGLDEMFNRLEKLECMKRQSQEEIGLLNGMNSLPSAGGGYNGPSSVWEPKLGAARCNTLSEHDEFVSLPPMSPSSTSPGDTTSSGAISPLQRMTTSPPCHVNAPSVQGSTGGMGHQQPQQHNSNFIPFTCQATMGTNLPHRAQHLKGVCGEPYHSVGDTPSCDLSRDGNSPTDYCYQCSTMNSSNQPNLSRGDRAGIQGGGIESQCSSIESNCINNMCTAATATQQALPHTGYHAAAANHNSMKAVSAVGDFCDCKLSNCSSSANVLADKSAGAGSYFASSQNVHGSSGGPYSSQRNISTQHSGSEVTVVSARGVRSPHMDMSVMQNNTSFNNNALNTSTALRSNSVGRKVAPPPVPMRRFATLSSSGGVDEAIEPEASETLLGGSQQQGHQNYQSQQQHGLQRIKQGLSRTASINSQVTHLPEDAVSRTSETSVGMASVAGSESVMFDDLYDLSNRAKLPRGVENIRPHLEHVDNVPLLVPLFTDCTPEATKEMVVIMQENCEVVCVYGSCLNVTNVDIFLQADVSIGVMPFVPQPCVRHPVNFDTHLPDGRHLTPLGLASTLGALPCSLQVLRNVKLTNVFKSASRLSGNLKTALFFLLSCHLALVCVQILSAICLQPPAFSGSLILWLVGFIFPILSSALLANPTCPNTQQWTTMHKNNPKIHKMEVRDFAACFAMRFLPTCILIPLLELFHLDAMCQLTVEPKECFVPFGNLNSTEPWNGLRGSSSGALVVTQNIITWIFVVCLTLISASFVFPKTYIWKKCPLKNLFWTIISPAIIALQMFYLLSDVKSYSATPYTVWHSSGHGWIIGLIWPLFAVIISECVKTYEIRKAFRQHRRCKLQFGTKLGMNSPF